MGFFKKHKALCVSLLCAVVGLGIAGVTFADTLNKGDKLSGLVKDSNSKYNSITMNYLDIEGKTAYCVEYLKKTPGDGLEYEEKFVHDDIAAGIMAVGYADDRQTGYLGLPTWGDAYMATQLAVWHHITVSGKYNPPHPLNLDNVSGLNDKGNAIVSKAKELYKQGVEKPVSNAPTLSITPAVANAVANEDGTFKAGPFTVNTNSNLSEFKLNAVGAEGLAIMDSSDKEVTSFSNGTQFFVKGTTGGTKDIKITASGKGSKTTAVVFQAPSSNSDMQNVLAPKELTTLVDAGATIQVTKPEIKPSKVEVIKTCTETNCTGLDGTEFTLTSSDGKTTVGVTQGNKVIFENLKEGKYTLKETKATENHKLNEKEVIIDVVAGKDISENFENVHTEQKGIIEVHKVEEGTNKPLAGVKFNVLNTENKVVEVLVTGADGKAKTGKLPAGTYTIKETIALPGYVVTNTNVTATVEADKTATVEITNKKEKGKITVVKKDESSKQPLAGAEFELFVKKGTTTTKPETGKPTTSETGSSSHMHPSGTPKQCSKDHCEHKTEESMCFHGCPAHFSISTCHVFNCSYHGNGSWVGGRPDIENHKHKEDERCYEAGCKIHIKYDITPETNYDDPNHPWTELCKTRKCIYHEGNPTEEIDYNDPKHPYSKYCGKNECRYHKTESKAVDNSILRTKGDVQNSPTPINTAVTTSETNGEWISLGKKTSGADGRVDWTDLDLNCEYKIVETKAPEGYDLNNNALTTTLTNVNSIFTGDFFNKKKEVVVKGEVSVIKKDKDDNKPLPSAEFELFGKKKPVTVKPKKPETDTQEDKPTTIVTTSEDGWISLGKKVSDASGKVTWTNLNIDMEYKVVETKAPKGYLLNNKDVLVFNLTKENNNQSKDFFNEKTKGEISVVKKDKYTKLPLPGAIFELYEVGDLDTPVEPPVKPEVPEVEPPVKPEVPEVEKPVKPEVNPNKHPHIYEAKKCDTKHCGETATTMENSCPTTCPVHATISKCHVFNCSYHKDHSGGTPPNLESPSHEFSEKYCYSGGCKIHVDYKVPETANHTDPNHKEVEECAKVDCPYYRDKNKPGSRTAVVTNEESFSIESGEPHAPRTDCKVEGCKVLHDETNEVQNHKHEEGIACAVEPCPLESTVNPDTTKPTTPETPKPTPVPSTWKKVGEATTGADGKATFKNLSVNKKYVVKEKKAPNGYILDTVTQLTYSLTVDNPNQSQDFYNDRFIDGELTKTDVSTGELLPNAKFKIYAEDKTTVVVEGQTDEKGIFKFKLKPGKYFYQEYEAPVGYVIDKTLFPFEIKGDMTIFKAEMKNTPIKGNVVLNKVDIGTKNPLAGAEFVIKDANGKEVATGTGDSSGKLEFKDLKYGKYTYQETKAPEGYTLDTKEYPFEIKLNKETVIIEVTNQKLPHTGVDDNSIPMLPIAGVGVLALGGIYFLIRKKFM